MDFFKYAQGGSAKRKAAESTEGGEIGGISGKRKKARVQSAAEEESSEDGDERPPQRHRVTTKGANIPPHIDSFQELQDRYHISSHLLANLKDYGYNHPTGIQSYGIPILMEVRCSFSELCMLILKHTTKSRDVAAISPTGTGKTLSYLLPVMSSLGAPSGSKSGSPGGVRALVIAPTRELAHQIHNECLKLAQGRKWKIVLFSKATASTLGDKSVRDKVG